MSTSSELKDREIRSKEHIAQEDRRQRRESERRGQDLNYAGKVIGTMGGIIGKMNDPDFYKRLPGGEVVNASIPDFQTLGVEDSAISHISSTGNPNVPAVMRVLFIPTFGNLRNKVVNEFVTSIGASGSAANRALNRVATQLEQRNSRVSQYSRDTIGRYLFIATDIAADIQRVKTAIDVFDMADATKPFIARQLIRAMGFNYHEFKKNIANIRASYVLVVNDFNEGIPLPKDLSFTKRQLWLSNTIVKDMKSEWCTYLVFCKAHGFRFGDPTLNRENIDDYVAQRWPTQGVNDPTLNSIRTRIEELVNGATWKPLIRDLRGGTKSDSWLKLVPDVTTKTAVFTDYDEVRSQVHNMDTLPCLYDSEGDATLFSLIISGSNVSGDTSESVTQNAYNSGVNNHHTGENPTMGLLSNVGPGSILVKFASVAERAAWRTTYANALRSRSLQSMTHPYVLDSYGKMSSDSALVSSRLKLGWVVRDMDLVIASGQPGYVLELEHAQEAQQNAGTYYYALITPIQHGTEIVTSFGWIRDVDDVSEPVIFYYLTCSHVMYEGDSVSSNETTCLTTELISAHSLPNDLFMRFLTITAYDWHPLTKIEVVGNGIYDDYRLMGELDHYTTYLPSLQEKLNEQAIESEFTLPSNIYLKPLA